MHLGRARARPFLVPWIQAPCSSTTTCTNAVYCTCNATVCSSNSERYGRGAAGNEWVVFPVVEGGSVLQWPSTPKLPVSSADMSVSSKASPLSSSGFTRDKSFSLSQMDTGD